MRGVWIEIPGELSPLTNSSLGSTFEQYLLDEYLFERLNKTIKLRGNTFVQPSLEVIVSSIPKRSLSTIFRIKKSSYVATGYNVCVNVAYDYSAICV